ncbi:MAG: CvpA family protein [Bacteroidales bacterium]|nr:CvpA family protein [Bacteroidales bacterium]
MSLNFIDYIILVILALFVIQGYRKGIIISLASIAALVLGIYVAVHFSNYLDATLMEHLKPSRKWLPILSFSITFLLVVIAVMIVGKLTERLVDVIGMGFFNHLGGAVLGVVKGVVLISILFFIFTSIDAKGKWLAEKDKQDSFFYSQVAAVFPKLMKTFGGEIKFPSW